MLVEVHLCPSCSVEFMSIKGATEPLFSSADGDTCSNCSRSGLDLSEWTQKGTRVNRSCRALLCDLFKQKSKMSALVGWGHISYLMWMCRYFMCLFCNPQTFRVKIKVLVWHLVLWKTFHFHGTFHCTKGYQKWIFYNTTAIPIFGNFIFNCVWQPDDNLCGFL